MIRSLPNRSHGHGTEEEREQTSNEQANHDVGAIDVQRQSAWTFDSLFAIGIK